MLLGHFLLKPSGRRRAAQVWAVRERTEHEVSRLFERLAEDLSASSAPPELVRRAKVCAADELVHAVHCRRIVDALDPSVQPLIADLTIRLGPAQLSVRDRALYASVALGCITESLSTALLIEMRRHAAADVLREGLDRILQDEVQHSRLGWAHLALMSQTHDVSWLSPHVGPMWQAAIASEHSGDEAGEQDALRVWGILPPAQIAQIAQSSWTDVIAPGLRTYAIAS